MSARAGDAGRAVPWVIRLARPGDALRIATLSRDRIETGLGWSWTPQRVRRALAARSTVAISATFQQAVTGFAIMTAGHEHGHLSLLAVDARWARRGMGRALVEWLVHWSRCAGLESVRLELRSANQPARAFYRALGFEAIAIAPGYYGGMEAALRMEMPLRGDCQPPAPWTVPQAWRREPPPG